MISRNAAGATSKTNFTSLRRCVFAALREIQYRGPETLAFIPGIFTVNYNHLQIAFILVIN